MRSACDLYSSASSESVFMFSPMKKPHRAGAIRLNTAFVYFRYIYLSSFLVPHFHKLDFFIENVIKFVAIFRKFIFITRNRERDIRHTIADILSELRDNVHISTGGIV